MSKTKFAHERVHSPCRLASQGRTKYRSITTPSGAVLRIAFPSSRRKTGSGRLQAILHPKKNPVGNPLTPKETRNVIAEALVHKRIKGIRPGSRKYYQGMADGMLDIAEEYGRIAGGDVGIRGRALRGHLALLNPRLVKIYDRVIEIVARKGPGHKCDAECRAANHEYVHNFTGKHGIYGLADKSILIK